MPYQLPEFRTSPTEFPEAAIREAQGLLPSIGRTAGRKNISVVSVDPAEARERDDALHIEEQRLGISIVDPSDIQPSGEIFREALARGESAQRPMIPEILSRGALSLNADAALHPSITALVAVREDRPLLRQTQLLATASFVEQAFSYRAAQQAARNSESPYFKLFERVELLSRILRERGEILVDLMPTADSQPSREHIQSLVTICNRLFDTIATDFARRNKIPILYTNQQPVPTGTRERGLIRDFWSDPVDPTVRRHLERVIDRLQFRNEFSIEAHGHFTLHARAHANFSRPLRDIVAFINICNVSAFLRGAELPYTRDDLRQIGPYLTAAKEAREAAHLRTLHDRVVQKLVEPTANLRECTKREFRHLVGLAIERDELPNHLLNELLTRMREGEFKEPVDMVMIAAGAPIGSEKWQLPREACLRWIRAESHRGRTLLEFAQKQFTNWSSAHVELLAVADTWHSWVTATVDGKSYTLPRKIEVASANAAVRRGCAAFWQAYADGTLIEAETPLDEVLHFDYRTPIPKDIHLPAHLSPDVDKVAADKLHVVASVIGLGPPRFNKETRERGGQVRHVTIISGLKLLEAQPGVDSHQLSGRATNLTSERVLCTIRHELGVEVVTEATIAEARRRKWEKRLTPGDKQYYLLYRWPDPAVSRSFGAFADLQDICRANGWAELESEKISARRWKIKLSTPYFQIERSDGKTDDDVKKEGTARTIINELPELLKAHRPSDAKLPLGYILKTDTLRELRLHCLELGYSEPSFEVVVPAGKNKKSVGYICSVTLDGGEVFTTRATSTSGQYAMAKSIALMLQKLRPEYGGGGIYSRKVMLLRELYGYQIDAPVFSDEALVHKPSRTVKRCELIYRQPNENPTGVSLGYTLHGALDLASARLVRQIEGIYRRQSMRRKEIGA